MRALTPYRDYKADTYLLKMLDHIHARRIAGIQAKIQTKQAVKTLIKNLTKGQA